MRNLIQFINDNQAYSYLEVGVNEGYTLKKVIENTSVRDITVCDDWKSYYGEKGRGNNKHIIALLNKYKNINYKVIDGASQEQLPALIDYKKFDIINIDGDHSYKGTLEDIENALELVSNDGKIILHDHPKHKEDKQRAILMSGCEIEETLSPNQGYKYAVIRPVV